MKKHVALKLAELYGRKTIFTDAAKAYNTAASAAVAFSEKIKYHVKETEFYIKAGDYVAADVAMKKAFVDAKASERAEITFAVKDFYKRQALVYEKELRRSNAVKIYEKLLDMNISESERKEIKEKLLGLYEKLGLLKEYFALKNAGLNRK